jgi:hypothetical protein
LWAASVLAAHTSIESHDLVDQVEAFGTVGDQEHRPVFRRRQHVADECLRSRTVEMGRRLVQDQDGRIGEQRPGDGEPLPLAARKAATVLADQRVEAVGKARDPRVERGPYEDGVELRLRGLGARDEQVRTDGV